MRTFRVNDIFYSLQGEGHNTGRAAVFLRFAGCNMRCPFCDTEFDSFRTMTAEEIVREIAVFGDCSLIVLTGGEPTLQVDETFIELLHDHGYEVAMESNGTCPAPTNIDWLTVSPKSRGCEIRRLGDEETSKNEEGARSEERLPDELKIIFDEDTDPETFLNAAPATDHHPLLYLQPCDTGDDARNARIINRCVDYIKAHPQWRLSLQTHKLVGFK